MAQQKSDNRIVPEGMRKHTSTQENEHLEGGKAVAVNKQAQQLELFPISAENPNLKRKGAIGGVDRDLSVSMPCAVPKVGNKGKTRAVLATMEMVAEELETAFRKVASNKGAPGIDGQTIEEVDERWENIRPALRNLLLLGRYEPGEIRRVEIPKPSGGTRGLGIPNVLDRVVAEAIRRVLDPMYEPTFHPNSHGFRPNRGCHTAIKQAKENVSIGLEWVVDIDLKNFFDGVNHQRLMARLTEKIKDKRLLILLGKMLKASVVMPNGIKVNTEEGVPQGGPLSPLLSNVVLDELDKELARRGHRFVRYADDCNIYVGSHRAGQRVMESVKRFIEKRLRLKVNEKKSAVARTKERHFVGFRLKAGEFPGEVEILLSKRTRKRIDKKIVELTPRNWGSSLKNCIKRLNKYLQGWLGFFGLCTNQVESTLRTLDAHIRRRLRAILLKQWKRKRTIAKKLISLGTAKKSAWKTVYKGRKSIWPLSITFAVHRGLRNVYFEELGLFSLAKEWKQKQNEAKKDCCSKEGIC